MKNIVFIIFITTLGTISCSKDLSSIENGTMDNFLLIVQSIESNGKVISGNDSMIGRIEIDPYPRFFFEQSDTTLYLLDYYNEINNIKSIIISQNIISSTADNGSTYNIYFFTTSSGFVLDSLFWNPELKYGLDYSYIDSTVEIFSPDNVSKILGPNSIFKSKVITTDSLRRHSILTGEDVQLIYEYTHNQEVINYGFINGSKIKIIK